MNDKRKNPDLQLAFDVGHSSIGWAVLQTTISNANLSPPSSVSILGCGTVIFRADDCLASARRGYRRQRRHIRSTRQRIARMKLLLKHLGVLNDNQLNAPGCGWPWKLAAKVLASGGKQKLSWPELWDVLRWYAHNRGYDGNRRWSAAEIDTQEEQEDTEKLENAKNLLRDHGVESMAETFCKVLGVDPLGQKSSSKVRFKGLNAAFPREVVEKEVRSILRAHFGTLNGVDATLERALCGRDNRDKDAWEAIPCPAIKLPKRYEGGLLFGQLVPRFDNRIISACPVTGEKVPSRNCREFFDFRWAMQLANVRVARNGERELRPLSAQERKAIDAKMRTVGSMTARQLTEAVEEVTRATRSNLETMLMHPDAKEALLLDPVQKELTSGHWATLFPRLPDRIQKRARGQLRRGRPVTLGKLYAQTKSLSEPVESFDSEIQRILDAANTKKRKKEKPLSREEILGELASVKKLSGRAAYSRPILRKAYEEVMAGKHPKEDGGCLFVTEQMRQAQLRRKIDEQTNNHLVRHRLKILHRLQRDIIKEYAGGDTTRIRNITIEVNRDLREMSGKTAKEKAQDLGLRLANFKEVEKYVTGKLPQKYHKEISAGFLRKARVAHDLGWHCPYTGQPFDPLNLLNKGDRCHVDKDHIVPRSQRQSDSLESLVITFSAINKWKGKRTALKFVEDEQGKSVPDLPNYSIVSLKRYLEFIDALPPSRDPIELKRRSKHRRPIDDDLRRWRRKKLLKLREYSEGEFLPRDLTQTSQLARLGAEILKREYAEQKEQPNIISMPGSVTGAVRKGINLLGCLSDACPQVLDEHKEVKTKTDIREITHLHHALDACVLGLASQFIPNNGSIWELIVKRKLSDSEKEQLRFATRGLFNYSAEGFRIAELPKPLTQQLRKRLAEKRVVQHVPKRMNRLPADLNMWRLHGWDSKGKAILEKHSRELGTGKRKKDTPKAGADNKLRLVGWEPKNGDGKLKRLKAVLITNENYGVALDPEPTIIPFLKVGVQMYKGLNGQKSLIERNGGKMPKILRSGQLVSIAKGTHTGDWRVFSIKNNANGVALSLGERDAIACDQSKQNVLVRQLIKDGLTILITPLTGASSCPSTSSA